MDHPDEEPLRALRLLWLATPVRPARSLSVPSERGATAEQQRGGSSIAAFPEPLHLRSIRVGLFAAACPL